MCRINQLLLIITSLLDYVPTIIICVLAMSKGYKVLQYDNLIFFVHRIRRALSNILKQLDNSVGNLVSTNSSASRAPEESLG